MGFTGSGMARPATGPGGPGQAWLQEHPDFMI